MFGNNLKNKIPKIEFKTNFHGIEAEVATDRNGQINLTAKFYIKRKDINKRWSRIEGDLPDSGIIQVTADRHRRLEFFPKEEVLSRINSRVTNTNAGLLKFISSSRNNITCNAFQRNLEHREYKSHEIPMEDLVKYDSRSGRYCVLETLGITVTIPLMFHMNLVEELDRIVELRKLIIALNTKYKSLDRIDQLNGLPTYPEYMPEELEDLRSKGYWNQTPYELRTSVKNKFELALW